MFERYTEKARRVIFFARYEASQFGSPYIETEHLLLGLIREDKALANRFLRSHAAIESIRKQIEAHTTMREKVSTSIDLPLSHECKRVLAYGAEEAERLSHKHIGTEHLMLGLLREEKCFAAEILHERGLRLSQVREEIARSREFLDSHIAKVCDEDIADGVRGHAENSERPLSVDHPIRVIRSEQAEVVGSRNEVCDRRSRREPIHLLRVVIELVASPLPVPNES